MIIRYSCTSVKQASVNVLGRIISRECSNTGDQRRCAVIRQIINQSDAATVGLNSGTFWQDFVSVVTTLGVNIWLEGAKKFISGVVLEDHNHRDRNQCSQQPRPFSSGDERTTRAFQPSRTAITVQADVQRIAERACFLQIIKMTDVQQIEMAVGENQALASTAQGGAGRLSCFQGEDVSHKFGCL